MLDTREAISAVELHQKHFCCGSTSADQLVFLYRIRKGSEHALVVLPFYNVLSHMAAAWQDPDVSGGLSWHSNLPLRDQ